MAVLKKLRADARRRSGEAGESLIELLVTISILGIGIVALVAGLAAAVTASAAHREQADAGAVARNIAEAIKDTEVGLSTNGGNYSAAWSDVDLAGTTPSVSSECWAGNTPATFGACPNGDLGLQRITITVSDPHANETVTILKRRVM